MRHRSKKRILDRKKAPRDAMLKNLTASVILYEKVKTTKAKASVVRSRVEKAITKGKNNDLTSRRYLIKSLPVKSAVDKTMEVLGPKYKERPGGYTHIVKLGRRRGDGAEMVQIELV